MSCFDQIIKTVAIWTLTSYLTRRPSKIGFGMYRGKGQKLAFIVKLLMVGFKTSDDCFLRVLRVLGDP